MPPSSSSLHESSEFTDAIQLNQHLYSLPRNTNVSVLDIKDKTGLDLFKTSPFRLKMLRQSVESSVHSFLHSLFSRVSVLPGLHPSQSRVAQSSYMSIFEPMLASIMPHLLCSTQGATTSETLRTTFAEFKRRMLQQEVDQIKSRLQSLRTALASLRKMYKLATSTPPGDYSKLLVETSKHFEEMCRHPPHALVEFCSSQGACLETLLTYLVQASKNDEIGVFSIRTYLCVHGEWLNHPMVDQIRSEALRLMSLDAESSEFLNIRILDETSMVSSLPLPIMQHAHVPRLQMCGVEANASENSHRLFLPCASVIARVFYVMEALMHGHPCCGGSLPPLDCLVVKSGLLLAVNAGWLTQLALLFLDKDDGTSANNVDDLARLVSAPHLRPSAMAPPAPPPAPPALGMQQRISVEFDLDVHILKNLKACIDAELTRSGLASSSIYLCIEFERLFRGGASIVDRNACQTKLDTSDILATRRVLQRLVRHASTEAEALQILNKKDSKKCWPSQFWRQRKKSQTCLIFQKGDAAGIVKTVDTILQKIETDPNFDNEWFVSRFQARNSGKMNSKRQKIE